MIVKQYRTESPMNHSRVAMRPPDTEAVRRAGDQRPPYATGARAGLGRADRTTVRAIAAGSLGAAAESPTILPAQVLDLRDPAIRTPASAAPPGPQEPATLSPTSGTTAPRRSHRIARALPILVAVAAIGSLLVAVNPRAVTGSLGHFDLRATVPLLLVAATFYLLQGWRWHLLLRAVGVRERAGRSQLINLAGQSVTAVLPLGDLTRALLASETSGVPFGAVAATVTVQELTFSLLLVVAAAPGLIWLPGGVAWMVAVVAGVGGVVAILTVPPVFDVVRRGVALTPGLRRFRDQVDSLRQGVVHLLRRPEVLAGSLLDLGRALAATAGMLLILRGLGVDALGWWQVALVVAVAYVGGAISLLPGGVGANEATVVGILVLLGVDPAHAAAAALLQRLWLTGFATAGGLAAFAILRRLHLTSRGALHLTGAVPGGASSGQPVHAQRQAA